MLKHFVAAVFGVAVSAQVATAAGEIQTTKVESAPSPLPNAYGLVTLRNYQLARFKEDSVGNDKLDGITPYHQARLTLGSTWFNDKLDTSATFYIEKKTESTQVRTLAPDLLAEYSVVSGDYGWVKPYVEMLPSFQGKKAIGEVGVDNLAQLPINTSGGKVTLASGFKLATVLAGGKETAKVANAEENPDLGLGRDGDDVITTKKDQSLLSTYLAKATWEVSEVKGLSSTAAVEYFRNFNPNYFGDETQADGVKMDGYNTEAYTESSVDVSYQVNDTITFSNTTFFKTQGFYQKSNDVVAVADIASSTDYRWMNRLMISANLF